MGFFPECLVSDPGSGRSVENCTRRTLAGPKSVRNCRTLWSVTRRLRQGERYRPDPPV